MKQKSTRAKGNELEKLTLGMLPCCFVPTNNSGAVSGNGDITSDEFRLMIDCKNKPSSDSITISKTDVLKLSKQARNYNKDWVLVCKGKGPMVTVTMELSIFADIIDQLYGYISEERYG